MSSSRRASRSVEQVRQLRLAFMFPLSCVRSGRAVRRAAAKFICCDAVSVGLTVPPYRDKRAMRLDRIRRFRDDCNWMCACFECRRILMASSVAWTRRETSCLSCTLACSEMEDDVERAALVFVSCHHFVLICLVFLLRVCLPPGTCDMRFVSLSIFRSSRSYRSVARG